MSLFKKKKDSLENQPSNQPRRVYSYYSSSSKSLNSNERQAIANQVKNEPKKRYLRSILKNWFYLLVGIILAITFIYSLRLNPPAKVIIDGPQYRSAEQYQQLIDSSLKVSWLNNFKPLVDESAIETYIKENLAEVSIVSIKSLIFGSHPQVILKTDNPLAIFSESDNKYVLGQNGRVLLPLADSSQINNLPQIINNSSVKAEEGIQFISPNQADAIEKIIYQFSANGGNLSNLVMEIPIQPNEILLKDSSKGNYYVRFSLDPETVEQQYGAYLAVINRLGSSPPTQYIDVRLAEKVFVR